MTKPKPLVEISVDDIYLYGKNEGNERFAVTKQEAKQIFDRLNKLDWDCENDSFWFFVERKIEEFLREKNEARK